MRRFGKKLIILFVVVIMMFTMEIPSISTRTPAQSVTPEFEHQLGKATSGMLPWENDEEFLRLGAEYRAFTRLAAFQTTLPDPLPGEEYNVGLAAEILAGTVLKPGQVFSMNETIGPRTIARGFREGPAYSGSRIIRVIGGGVCKISTTLYNVTILAGLEVIERHSHGMLVPYVPPGQDATVSYGTLDFKFRNSTDGPLFIWAEKLDNTLYMAFYGRTAVSKVTWRHEVLTRQEPPVIRHYNPELQRGEERVVQSGAAEIKVRNWLIVNYQNGRTELRDLGIDYYKPMAKIIEYG